jgi:hypothetical protein
MRIVPREWSAAGRAADPLADLDASWVCRGSGAVALAGWAPARGRYCEARLPDDPLRHRREPEQTGHLKACRMASGRTSGEDRLDRSLHARVPPRHPAQVRVMQPPARQRSVPQQRSSPGPPRGPRPVLVSPAKTARSWTCHPRAEQSLEPRGYDEIQKRGCQVPARQARAPAGSRTDPSISPSLASIHNLSTQSRIHPPPVHTTPVKS